MEAVWLSFSDWCSDVVSSDLAVGTLVRALRRSAAGALRRRVRRFRIAPPRRARRRRRGAGPRHPRAPAARLRTAGDADQAAPEGTLFALAGVSTRSRDTPGRSEEHTSELQSLMRISYAVFCLKKKKHHNTNTTHNRITPR